MDAQFDTGTLGQDILYLGKDLEEGAAVFWYGLIAGLQSILAIGLYMLTTIEDSAGFLPFKIFVNTFVGIWSPTFFTWLGVVIFDSNAMRQLFAEAVHISVAGPFGLYWLGLAEILIAAIWDSWGWWLTICLMLVYSLVSILYQAIFVPKVVSWIENAPLKEYPAALAEKEEAESILDVIDKDESLLALGF